jgi:hypothetical protein
MQLEHLLRSQTRNAQHFEHACWDFLAHGFECRVCARAMQLRDDIRDCFSHSGNFPQPVLRNQLGEGRAETEQVLRGPPVGARARYGLPPRNALRCASSTKSFATSAVSGLGMGQPLYGSTLVMAKWTAEPSSSLKHKNRCRKHHFRNTISPYSQQKHDLKRPAPRRTRPSRH